MSGLNVYRTDIWVLITTGQLFREGFPLALHPVSFFTSSDFLSWSSCKNVLHRNGWSFVGSAYLLHTVGE